MSQQPQAEGMVERDSLIERPRRRVELLAKISADSWDDLQNHLQHLRTEIAIHGTLPTQSVSGGYSTGHIIVTSEDSTITHDTWAADLDSYLEGIRAREAALAEPERASTPAFRADTGRGG